ncbi:hypothetical protein OKJ48_22505 [Streptomyces kunmingensis]|uniref:WXG100 family type VII secretion target n=1 Tax=Streptomyces kunmingensis TaxID=68225 RepID=A0ABU6CEG1_9ACTN|nr:hypothetical protein [Streptomyces kunmingensis]MEB3962997.1 hypothetical protein [Streptomyces kunmingensis]
MSTPTGSTQQSSTATYSQAIESLNNAKTQMTTIQGQVEAAKADLQARYGGEDGRAYARVMETWLSEVDRIKSTCDAMQNQLTNSMHLSDKTQLNNLETVHGQTRLSALGSPAENNAFSTMTGN